MQKKLKLILLLAVAAFTLNAQEPLPPYWNDIQSFKKQDSLKPPKAGAILFIGSSSFTNWKDVQSYFPNHRILNRGFGGSTLQDVLYYAKDIVVPYKPKQVVIYCGENDLASSDTVTPSFVMKRFELLYYFIRKHYPKIPIVFISLKPSPSRQHLMPKMEAVNKLVKHFLAGKSKSVFVNIYNKMLNPDGTPRKELFLEDMLHMNAKGYAIWQKALAPHLLK
jgi:lysophospholipase L1-like esterase